MFDKLCVREYVVNVRVAVLSIFGTVNTYLLLIDVIGASHSNTALSIPSGFIV